jgi:2'-5' RNA ligase
MPFQPVDYTARNAMSDQLSLLDTDAQEEFFELDRVADPRRRLLGYQLILALIPEPEGAACAVERRAGKRKEFELFGAEVSEERLHITLLDVGFYLDAVPQAQVDAVRAAVASVAHAPMAVTFDQAMTFPESKAFVLLCDAKSDADIAKLRASLLAALRTKGIAPKQTRNPHMTLLYDEAVIAKHPIDPLHCAAAKLVFLISHQGLNHHQWVDLTPEVG